MSKKVVIGKGKEESKAKVAAAHKKPGGSNVGKYKSIKSFAGPSGGAPAGSYPINDRKHAKAALAYAHNAPNPAGIKSAVHKKFPGLGKPEKKSK